MLGGFIMKKTKKDIKYGTIEIDEDEFNPKHAKFRVNMFMDMDVLDKIRELAAKEHTPYQTWINKKLREIVEGDKIFSITKEEIFSMIDERLKEVKKKRA